MTTALYGIVILCLLTIIHDDNMKTEAAVMMKKIEAMIEQSKQIAFTRCCAGNCWKYDMRNICKRKKTGRTGCQCYRHDDKYTEGGYWVTF